MSSFSVFTKHARKRLRERCSMTADEILLLKDNGCTLFIGNKPGTFEEHHLFFSAADSSCFVFIQDKMNGSVITILPVHYHNTCAWEVSIQQQEEVKAKYENFIKHQWETQRSVASVFSVTRVFIDDDGIRRVKAVGKIQIEGTPETFLDSSEMWSRVHELLLQRGVVLRGADYLKVCTKSEKIAGFYEMPHLKDKLKNSKCLDGSTE